MLPPSCHAHPCSWLTGRVATDGPDEVWEFGPAEVASQGTSDSEYDIYDGSCRGGGHLTLLPCLATQSISATLLCNRSQARTTNPDSRGLDLPTPPRIKLVHARAQCRARLPTTCPSQAPPPPSLQPLSQGLECQVKDRRSRSFLVIVSYPQINDAVSLDACGFHSHQASLDKL
ncbi:hypothetical protein BD626DRAFT_238392 [Schizophyllum amplum]|uniref:Uncharacterized protein n=1 Tax=Schizophyllum amplum TaxID=97359 RepID=A0A550CJJ7_9AGAR|nr:hypothetical protein BD626DRAFT_238392 [Auriculariopsis ampla]